MQRYAFHLSLLANAFDAYPGTKPKWETIDTPAPAPNGLAKPEMEASKETQVSSNPCKLMGVFGNSSA